MSNRVPDRRSIRLPEYDYSQSGIYAVTICAYNKKCLFGGVSNEIMEMNEIGRLVSACWQEIPKQLHYVDLLDYIVMPNHLHGIIIIDNDGRIMGTASRAHTRTEAFGKPSRDSLPTIIRSYKSGVTRRINQPYPDLYSRIWQRGYYERVVRNEKELRGIIDYIITNPENSDKDPDRLL